MTRLTFKDQACKEVPSFEHICNILTRKFMVAGKSKTCVRNYITQISKLVIYYKRSPLDLNEVEIEEYMVIARKNESPSLSSFKHLVCGLRHVFMIFDKNDLYITLPKIHHPKTLPTVLSKEEIRLILKTPEDLKQRIILGTIYDGGLRISEAINLHIADVDLNRKMIHIRQSKYRKDRYVPISNMLVRGIKQYLIENKPKTFLFNGQTYGMHMSATSIQRIMRIALKNCKIEKRASVHTLRHSYATHLLEDGLDIVSLKNQLGHADIKNTMTYIHIAQISPLKGFSPLSKLY